VIEVAVGKRIRSVEGRLMEQEKSPKREQEIVASIAPVRAMLFCQIRPILAASQIELPAVLNFTFSFSGSQRVNVSTLRVHNTGLGFYGIHVVTYHPLRSRRQIAYCMI
jgi:hypothetical protein